MAHTPQKNLEVTRGLIATANATTGKTDTDLTSAVGSLVEGFGQGGGSVENSIYYAKTLSKTFNSVAFPENYELIVDTERCSSFEQSFMSTTNVKKITVRVREEVSSISFRQMAYGSSLEVLDISGVNTEKVTDALNMCYACPSLREIVGELAFPSINSSIFRNCRKLEEIRFKKGTIRCDGAFELSASSLLSDASIQSIIDGLADLTGQTSQTIQFHSTVKAKLTEEQIATITSKNWTLA